MFCNHCGSSVQHTDTPTDKTHNQIAESDTEEIPMPKLSACFGLVIALLLSIVAFIFAIQYSFLFGLVCLYSELVY